MPQSKHRRKGNNRPRPQQQARQEAARQEPSPDWVPRVGVGLLLAGVIVIILGYIPAVASTFASLPGFGSGWSLVLGFVLMVGGFGVLTRWR